MFCSGVHEFLLSLERYADEDFQALSLPAGGRLHVCGETLEQCDLETLLNSNWVNDKARLRFSVNIVLICSPKIYGYFVA